MRITRSLSLFVVFLASCAGFGSKIDYSTDLSYGEYTSHNQSSLLQESSLSSTKEDNKHSDSEQPNLTESDTLHIESQSINDISSGMVEESSISEGECLVVTFDGSVENQYSCVGCSSFEIDYDHTKECSVDDNVLKVAAGGTFSFSLSEAIKNISIEIANSPGDQRVRVGLINKGGLRALYDPTINGSQITYTFKETQTANHIIIETACELLIASIKMTLK